MFGNYPETCISASQQPQAFLKTLQQCFPPNPATPEDITTPVAEWLIWEVGMGISGPAPARPARGGLMLSTYPSPPPAIVEPLQAPWVICHHWAGSQVCTLGTRQSRMCQCKAA